VCTKREVVALLPREAREVVHDDEVDFALVRAAVRQQGVELAAVRGLGAFAFFVEAFADLVALATAVLLAGTEWGRQTEVLRLLLRTDANVITAPTISDRLDPIVGAGKVCREGTVIYPGIRRRSTNISTTICAIVSACRRIISMS
jgi:hypothetical protein